MSRSLVILNVLFVTFVIGAGLYIARELRAPQRRSPVGHRAPTTPAAPSRPGAGTPTSENYTIVATRTLFNPGRSDRAVSPVAAGPVAPPPVKPSLHGIILRDDAPVAYLEDPATKRVAGYRLGDTIVGGSVKTIAADHVVIARPDGNIDIRLHDPAKPRPTPPPAGAGGVGAQGRPGGPGVPGGGIGTPPLPAAPPAGEGPPSTPPASSLTPTPPSSAPTRRAVPPDLPRPSRDD
jgi:hypothetical protein